MQWLAEDGIDYGHVSSLDFAARSVKYPDRIAFAYIRAGLDRALPPMCAGSVRSRPAALAVSRDFIRYMTTAVPVSSMNIVAAE